MDITPRSVPALFAANDRCSFPAFLCPLAKMIQQRIQMSRYMDIHPFGVAPLVAKDIDGQWNSVVGQRVVSLQFLNRVLHQSLYGRCRVHQPVNK